MATTAEPKPVVEIVRKTNGFVFSEWKLVKSGCALFEPNGEF